MQNEERENGYLEGGGEGGSNRRKWGGGCN